MARFRVKLKGAGRLKKRLEAADEQTRDAVRDAVSQAAKAIQADARDRVPRDTGKLGDSIRVETSEGGMNASVVVGEHYGPMVEYGTRSMPAQPYLTPAAETERKKFPNRVDSAVKKRLDLK